MNSNAEAVNAGMREGVVGTKSDSILYMNRTLVMGFTPDRKTGKLHEYVISKRKVDDRWCCSCPHWTTRLNRAGGDCKHILHYKNIIQEMFKDVGGVDKGRLILITSLQNILLLSGSKVLGAWMSIKDKALMMDDYMQIVEADYQATDYCKIFTQVRSHVAKEISS